MIEDDITFEVEVRTLISFPRHGNSLPLIFSGVLAIGGGGYGRLFQEMTGLSSMFPVACRATRPRAKRGDCADSRSFRGFRTPGSCLR